MTERVCRWLLPHRDKHNCGCQCKKPYGHKGYHRCELDLAAVEAPVAPTPAWSKHEIAAAFARSEERTARLEAHEAWLCAELNRLTAAGDAVTKPPKCICFRQWLQRPDEPVVNHDPECPLAPVAPKGES